MKTRLTGATFDASAKTITHTSFSDVTLAGIQLITNVTDQIIIYNFADTAKGGTLSTDTLTLEYDTTSMSDTDELMILVEDGSASTAINDGGNTITVDGTVSVTGVSTAANQTTIIGHLDGVEGLLTTIDADTGTIATEVAGLLTDTELRATPVPVSGTVAVTNSGITTIAGAVSGTEMQVDVLTMPTTTVQATNLDIRDLSSASDTVTVHGDVGVIDQLDLTNSNPATVAIVDGDGTQITSFGGGTQYTEGDTDASLTGTVAMVEGAANAVAAMTQPLTDTQLRATDVKITLDGESVPVTGTFWQATQPISGTVTATATDLDIRPLVNTDVVTAELSAVDNAVLDTIAAKDFATQTTLAAINTKLVSGTDIGDVTINNASGASAVNIQDGGNTITVDYATTGSGTATGALRVELPTNGTGVIATVGAVTAITNALPAGTNAIGKLSANSGVDIGDVDILSIAAGTNNIGNVGVIPRTSGGATPYKLVSAATTNATSVKGSAGQIFMITASNVNAAVRYLKLYNKASAPTVGSDTPVLTFAIPGNTAGAGTNIPIPACGIAFGTGIAFALTTEATDAGSTGVAANEIVINMAYA